MLKNRNTKAKKGPIGPLWVRWLLFTAGALCMGLAIAIAVLWLNFDSLSTVASWAKKYTTYVPLTALLYAVPIFLLGAAFGRLWLSSLLVGSVGMILALVDYFKNMINGTPLELADFGLASKLSQVAGVAGDLVPPIDFWRGTAVLLVCVLLLYLFRRLTEISGSVRFLSLSMALIVLIQLFSTSGAAWVGNTFGVDVYASMPAAQNHNVHGLTLALWRDLMLQKKEAPEGYSEEMMQAALTRIDEILADGDETAATEPNVIMILSESFFDLNRLPGLRFERDPLENFHALEKEAISGSFFSHYLGYGTGYIEMAMQYGITNHDFGASTNICFLKDEAYDYFDALPEQYGSDGGYQRTMMHSFNDSLYNRTVTYPRLGYSSLLFSADMQNMGIEWEGNPYGGYYLKDTYLMEALMQELKNINASGKKAFLYGISMENHQPFDAEKFGYVCQMGVESDTLSEEDMAIVRVMLEGHIRADQSLGYLTDALRKYPEPTVVVFFGDHRPNLFMTDGHTVYTKLGLCPSEDTMEWSLEQTKDIYSTDYMIWGNDAALLGDQAGTRKDSSATALGPDLLSVTHQPASRYWGLLQKVREVSLSNLDLYFVNQNSQPFRTVEDASLTPQQQELLQLRELVIYDAFYGKQYITAKMNERPGT